MEERTFNNIHNKVSLLGFGCMRLPLLYKDRPDIDEQMAQRMIDYAMAGGVNYYDTAYPYHEGRSELFIGKALKKYRRDRYNLASKMPMWEIKSEDDVRRIFHEQLKKCQVEYFDFYLLHGMNEENFQVEQKYHVYEILKELKAQGRIRHLGFSFHDTAAVLEKVLKSHKYDFVQLQINYLDWELQNAKKQYELTLEVNIPVIVMEPVRGGALATLNPQAAEILRAENPRYSPASWALRYVASLPNVMTVLSGMSSIEQVEDNIRTMSPFKALTNREREVLEFALIAYKSSGTIPCTGCRYCMDCLFGVNIPILFAAYNQYKIDHNEFQFMAACQSLEERQLPDKCIACNKCSRQCPQEIDIPARLKEVQALITKLGQK